MKVEKQMEIHVDNGTIQIDWDSKDQWSFSLSIDEGQDDRVFSVKRGTLIEMRDACDRMLAESDAAKETVKAVPKTSAKPSVKRGVDRTTGRPGAVRGTKGS